MITIDDILSPKHILLDLEANTQTAAVAQIAELLRADQRMKDWPQFETGLFAKNSSVEASEVCIAHVRTNAVSAMVMAVGRLQEAISAEDGASIRLIFVIGIPQAFASDYLRIIGAMARIFRSETGKAALLNAPTAEEFRKVLCTMEMDL